MSLMKKDIHKIAIVRLSALGDIVNSAVVVQFIATYYPNAQIDWISEGVFAPLLQTIPQLSHIHTLNLKALKKSKSLSQLKENIQKLQNLDEYDIVIDMQGLIKSSLVARFVGKNRHGFSRNSTRESLAALFYTASSEISYESNVIKRNTYLIGHALDFDISDKMLLTKKPLFAPTQEFQLRSDIKNIAFVIGASWESKIYPKELVLKVCEALKEQVYIIWGNEQELLNAKWICEHTEYASLAPKLALDELVAFISEMDLLIGNDTGPTHMAWAQNIPSITLLGPTTTRMIYETPYNLGIKSPSKVNILKINKNDFSIREIPYTTVVQKAKELLDGI